MTFYVLDSNFVKTDIIEGFESMIWTERYSRCGDFELLIDINSPVAKAIESGTMIQNSDSDRLMIAETKSMGLDTPTGMVEISGRSLEYLIERRPTPPMINQEDFYLGEASLLVMNAVSWGAIKNEFGVPLPRALTRLRMDYTNRPVTPIFASKPKKSSLYDYATSVTESVNLGFKITLRTFVDYQPYMGGATPPKDGWPPLVEANMFVFETFVGVDRTSKQTVNPLVAFRPDLENLSNSQYLESSIAYKNVANVWGNDNKHCLYDVTPEGVDISSIPTDELRWLVVDANDIQKPTSNVDFEKLLQARGRIALAEYQKIKIFDGEVYEQNSYVYNRDYFIGDIVELADAYGHKGASRVTEYIWAQDSSGIRAYPTFTSID